MRWKKISLWTLAVFFMLAGLNHFRIPDFYVSIMPPYLPWHLPLVYLSGAAEVGLGALLLWPGGRYPISRWAAYGLMALSLAVYPANLYMALHPELFAYAEPWVLWLRLPLQALLLVWLYWHTRKD